MRDKPLRNMLPALEVSTQKVRASCTSPVYTVSNRETIKKHYRQNQFQVIISGLFWATFFWGFLNQQVSKYWLRDYFCLFLFHVEVTEKSLFLINKSSPIKYFALLSNAKTRQLQKIFCTEICDGNLLTKHAWLG